ncbi:unnamed protein product, partial [Cladocopium goreaui]
RLKQRLKQIEKDNPAGPIYPYWKLLELTCGLTSRLKEVVAQPIDTLGAFTGAFLGVQWERRPSTTPTSPSAAPRSAGARQFVGRPRGSSEAPAKRQALISGTGEALATVLVSEMGDKTFFLTMILAMRKSRRLALLASQSALWIMMLISTSIGVMLRRLTLTVGDAVIMRVGAAVLMIFFGLQSFWELSSGAAGNGGSGLLWPRGLQCDYRWTGHCTHGVLTYDQDIA